MNAQILQSYFPELTHDQLDKFSRLEELYLLWNSRINVISRKDMDNFFTHHLLHSLAIAKVITFRPGTSILDVGTGGGFPGIPLAIMFPDCNFTLADSIGKKITVVKEVAAAAGIQNAEPLWSRVEDIKKKYEFIVSRAVTSFPAFVKMTAGKTVRGGNNELPNGILYLKGGEIAEEIKPFGTKVKVWSINQYFAEPFFETKHIVFLPS